MVAALAQGDTTYIKAAGMMAVDGPPMRPGWGYGVSVLDWGYTWAGGLGTARSNVPGQDLTVVLTQRGADETGMPAVCEGPLGGLSAQDGHFQLVISGASSPCSRV